MVLRINQIPPQERYNHYFLHALVIFQCIMILVPFSDVKRKYGLHEPDLENCTHALLKYGAHLHVLIQYIFYTVHIILGQTFYQ